jgi:hypothetical protein
MEVKNEIGVNGPQSRAEEVSPAAHRLPPAAGRGFVFTSFYLCGFLTAVYAFVK